MSKKPRGKSGSAAGGGGNKWEAGLLAAPIDEETWTASITLVACNKYEDKTHIDMLAHAVHSEARRQFGVVHRASLYEEVKELGNPKNKKGKDSPPHVDICETVRPILENGDELPLSLICRLIKFKILCLKQMDTLRIANEKKEVPLPVIREVISSRASARSTSVLASRANRASKVGLKNLPAAGVVKSRMSTITEAASDKEKGGAAAKGAKGGKDKPKSGGKKGKAGKTPEPPSIKGGTKLKKRGDEDEKVYIDDEPLDGASFYIILAGFNHPHIVNQLAEIGIYLDSVVKVNSESYPEPPPPAIVDENAPPKDEKTLSIEEEQRIRKEKEVSELESFWKDYPLLINLAPEGSKLHDMAYDEVTVNNDWIPEGLEDDKDGEKKLAYGMQVYEQVAVKAYDILDLKRQHKNFLKNLRLIHVPVHGEEHQDTAREADAGVADVDMRYYNDLMNSIPQESVSVPLVMHCMLEQIEAGELGKQPPSEVLPTPRADCVEHGLSKHIGGLAFKLALNESERQSLQTMFEIPESSPQAFKQPILYNKNDDIAFRTDHLSTVYGFNAKEAELAMLERLPLIGALELPDISDKKSLERAARLQELLHFCVNEGLGVADIDHIFKQFVFESMGLTSADEEGQVMPPLPQSGNLYGTQVIPWDDPYPFYRCMLPEEEEEEEEEEEAFPMPTDDEILSGLSASPSLMSAYSANTPRDDNVGHGLAPEPNTGSAPAKGDGSCPTTPGILRKQPSNMSRSDSRNSVHFSDADDVTLRELDPQLEPVPSTNPMEEFVPSAHKRALDEWCFAEHLDRHILLQTMKNASFTLPYVDTYYHKRDHCLLVVMHNPHNKNLQNEMNWSQKLHSNVGVRNYQGHVAELITDWTISEEAIYHANLLYEDVEQDITDAAKASATAAKEAKKGQRAGSKSPKGGRKGSAKSQSPKPSESGVENYITDSYIKEGSLKAQRAEKERIALELAEEERQRVEKADKRQKSGRKTADSSKGGKKKDDERKPSRAGTKQKQNKDEPAPPPEPPQDEPAEPYWPFTGYDLGTSKLMHVSGKVSTLFPTDGAIIRSERLDFVQGVSSVKTSVVKDGNVFMIHVIDPSEEVSDSTSAAVEKSETEESEKDKKERIAAGKHGSFTATFKDGMNMSFSTYGLQGEPDNFKKYEPAPYIAPAGPSPSPAPDTGAKASPTKKGKGKEKTGTTPEPPPSRKASPRPSARDSSRRPTRFDSRLSQTSAIATPRLAMPAFLQADELQEDDLLNVDPAETEEVTPEPPFQHINLTCPDGLTLSFHVESAVTGVKGEQRKLMVKQCYPYKTLGKHKCEEARSIPAMQEMSRVVRSDGTVIKNMSNGDVTILYSDGAVSKLTGVPAGANILQRPGSPLRTSSARSGREQQVVTPTRKGKKGKDQKNLISQEELDAQEVPVEIKGQWITTAPTGERVGKKLDGASLEVANALVGYASDPESGQMMITREDHVNIVTFPSSVRIVEHEDGTRITTFLKDVEKCSNSADQEQEKQDDQTLVRQQFVKIECPGYAAIEFNCYTSYCMVQFGTGSLMSVMPNGSYYLYHKDGFNLEIDQTSKVLFVPNPRNQPVPTKVGEVITSTTTQSNCTAGDLRYQMSHCDYITVKTEDPEGNMFTVRNDGTHSVTLSEQYQEKVKNSGNVAVYSKHAPRFFIVHSDMTGIELLRYQDIADFLAASEQDPSAAVLKEPVIEYPGVSAITVLKPFVNNSSQAWLSGFSGDSIIPPGLRSRDLKTLPAREIVTPGPKFGTSVGKGLAIGSVVKTPKQPPVIECPKNLEFRQIIQYHPVSSSTRETLYNNLRGYADYVCAREDHAEKIKAKDPRNEEDRKFCCDLMKSSHQKIKDCNIKSLYEKVTAPKIPSPPCTPMPRRTQADIERDRREKQEEKVHRQALKEKDVPPYFESELGRAFLISNSVVQRAKEAVASGVAHPDPAAMMARLAEDPTADVATVLDREPEIPQLNDDSSIVSDKQVTFPPRPASHSPNKEEQRMSFTEDLKTTEQKIPSAPDCPIHGERPADAFNKLTDNSPRANYAPKPISMKYDVTGSLRAQPVHVPDYITKGNRINSFPNQHYYFTENQVRRQVKTSSVANIKTRGIEVMPDFVDFGILKEGITYSFNVAIKNVGVDTCRYKIRSPPPGTGLKLVFVPGPIAAGMKAELKLELYAIAIGVVGESGSGYLSYDLEVTTETDVIYLPIRASVLTADEYSRSAVDLPRGGKGLGVKFVTDKPPNDYGVVRPRKDLKVASNGSDAILSILN